jgi:hypothetical protein
MVEVMSMSTEQKQLTAEDIDAMEAGPKMDALVAERVMGLPKAEFGDPCPYCGSETRRGSDRAWCFGCREWKYSPYCEYSTDIAAAWQVLDSIHANWLPAQIYAFTKALEGQSDFRWPYALIPLRKVLPLHICRAALKAVLHHAENSPRGL